MSLRDQILGTDDIATRLMEIPEWGVTVELRALTAGQRASSSEMARDESGEVTLARLHPAMLVVAVYDPESGEPVFSANDIPALMNKNSAVIQKVANVIMELNNFTEDAVDAEGKESSSTLNTDGGTSSPRSSEEQ